MDVEEEDDDDTHLCIKCKKTIVGLENYIMHRRQMCLYLESSNSPLLNTSGSPEHDNEKPSAINLTADDFFSSLELQSKTNIPKNSFMETHSSELQKQSEALSSLEQKLPLSNEEPCPVSHEEPDTQLDLSNSSEDCQSSFYPPRFHTGGKWKPGSRPDIGNHFQWDIHSLPSSPTDEIGILDDTVTKLNDTTSASTDGKPLDKEKQKVNECINKKTNLDKPEYNLPVNTNSKLKCQPCSKSFCTKVDMMFHMLSQEHKEKFDNITLWYEAVFSHQDILVHSLLFQCLVCHYYFNNHEEFCNHFRTPCHRQKAAQLKLPLLCVPCNFECRGSDDLLNHVISKEHHVMVCHISQYHPVVVREKANRYNCSYCDSVCQVKKFRDTVLPSFKKHNKLKFNGNSRVIESQNLIKSSNKISGLSKELETNTDMLSSKSSGLCCSHCNKLFAQHADLEIHMQLNHSKESHSCKLCNKIFCSSKELEDHIQGRDHRQKTLAQENSKGLKSCHKRRLRASSFHHSRRTILSTCKKQHDNNFVKKYSCPYCSKTFSKTHLKYHVFTHTGEKPFKCHICNKCFAQKGTLSIHVKRHLGLKHLQCDKCDFRTFRKSVLHRHQETHKTDRVRDSLCEICGAAYLDQWSLKQHMLSHNGCEYKCTYPGCHHSFRRQSELVYHMRVHTNERPYLCDICGYSGKTSHQLKKHQRSHTGERPFKCKHCDYRAALSSQLIRHMRLHTGSKPYKCPYCSYTCNAQGNIRKHILKTKKHAGKKMYPCKFCEFACNELQEYREHLLLKHKEHFPNGESQIDSSVSGVYIKDIPKEGEKLVPYFPRKRVMENQKAESKSEMHAENNKPSKPEAQLSYKKEQNKESALSVTEKVEKIDSKKQIQEEINSESVLYIAIPSTSNLCENAQPKTDYIISKNIEIEHKSSGESDNSHIVSVEDLISHAVSETYSYSNGVDGLGTQVLISEEINCVSAEATLPNGSSLQLSNCNAENNSENTIFIYMPFI